MRTHCKTDSRLIGNMLQLCDGNWHRCIYVHCNCEKRASCDLVDFLFLPDTDARPVLLPLADCSLIFARIPEPEECLLHITFAQFQEMYHNYLQQLNVPSNICPACHMQEIAVNLKYDW